MASLVPSARVGPCTMQRPQTCLHRLPAGLGACQARRGVALTSARQARAGAIESRVVYAKAASVVSDAPPQAEAHLRFTRGSPHKARRVLDLIRGRSYEEALMILEYTPWKACEPILKVLVSAAANAKENLGMKKVKLYISECFADGGPTLKRFQPRAKGRPYQILKPSVHITIKVSERDAVKEDAKVESGAVAVEAEVV